MNPIECHYQNTPFVTVLMFIITNIIIVQHGIAQCDPASIDPCIIGNNSIIQACYHAQIAKTSNGYSITGEDFEPEGFSHQFKLTNIPSDDYPMPSGVFPVWGAIGGRTQAVFLGSDENIYAVGEEDLMIDDSKTTGTAWEKTTLKLPHNLTVCDINKWEGSAGSGSDNSSNNSIATGSTDGFLVFSTFAGEAYITGDGAYDIQAEASNSDWTQINMPDGVVVVDFAVGYRTLLIQGSDGNLYASGSDTYLGDGTVKDINIITLLPVQPSISVFGISQIQAGFNSYLILDGDGTIHVLGENSEGGLGVGHIFDVDTWSKVGEECPFGILDEVAYISTVSTHDYRINSSAILIDGTIRSWGSNSRQSITTGPEALLACPITPTGNNRNAVAISNGGHISPYVNTSVQICNIGHNKDGAFGDGNDEFGDYGEYKCHVIPGMPVICGTQEANLSLQKTVNNTTPSTGNDIIFTITVTNNGPDPSTGSFVRDQLTDAFFYLGDDSNGAYNSSTGLWIVGPLEVGASNSINITVKAIEGGAQLNYAQILVDNEVDINSTPGDNSAIQDDDDFVDLEVFACPTSSDKIVLCPKDSILIDDNWIYESGIYVETIPLTAECDSLHITSVLYVEDPPKPIFQTDCETSEHHLSVNANSIWNPTWSNGDATYETTYTDPIEEAILLLETDPNCVEQIEIDLPPFANIDHIPILEDTTIMENTRLVRNTGLNTEEWNIQWTPESVFDCVDCTVGNIIGIENTEVTMYLEHISGCTFQSSFFLTVEKEPQNLFAPNIFSPNNDAVNNEWIVFTTPNVQIEACNIYDRWGNLVFQSKEGTVKWDGKFKGTECQQGVYVYFLRYKDHNNVPQLQSGDITLIR